MLNDDDLNYFGFSSIDENIFFNSFAFLQDHKVWNFEFRSLKFVCFLGFVIWNFHELNYSVNGYCFQKALMFKRLYLYPFNGGAKSRELFLDGFISAIQVVHSINFGCTHSSQTGQNQ